MNSLSPRILRIAVITPEVGLRRRISSSVQARGRICSQFISADDARPALSRGVVFDLLIIAVSGDGEIARMRLHDASALLGWPPTLLLVGPHQHDLIAQFMAQRSGNDFSLLSDADELEYRLQAFLSRESAASLEQQVRFGRYRFVTGTQQVFIGDLPVRLTRLEFDTALFLFRNIGRSVSREQLYQSVWKAELGANTRTIDAHITKVRKALRLVGSAEFVLRAIYRGGYKIDAVEKVRPTRSSRYVDLSMSPNLQAA